MNLVTGAFDIAWEDDNIENEPLVLEISPSYQLNPEIPERYKAISYKNFKKKLLIKDAYYKLYVDVVFQNRNEITMQLLSAIGKMPV